MGQARLRIHLLFLAISRCNQRALGSHCAHQAQHAGAGAQPLKNLLASFIVISPVTPVRKYMARQLVNDSY